MTTERGTEDSLSEFVEPVALPPEPPDGTRLEWESDTDVYAAWRDDASSAQAGWSTGDGGAVWCVYGGCVPVTWEALCATYGRHNLALAVRLVPVAEDLRHRYRWPTQIRQRRQAARAGDHG